MIQRKFIIKLLSVLICSFILVSTLRINVSVSAQDVETNSDSGYAYAVLQDIGDLIFFRSGNQYDNESNGIFIDDKENSYKGTVFCVDEINGYDSGVWPWDNYKESIIDVYVASGQTIIIKGNDGLFRNCVNLKSFDGSGFKYESMYMTDMFYNCTSLKTANISNIPSVMCVDDIFNNCTSLESITLGNYLGYYSGYAKEPMFPDGWWKNEEKDLIKSSKELFEGYSPAWSGEWRRATELSDSNAYAVLTYEGDLVFFRSYSTYNNKTGVYFDINNNAYEGTIFAISEKDGSLTHTLDNYRASIKNVYVAPNQTIALPIDICNMFSDCYNLETFNGKGFDTKDVEYMSGVFSGCSSLMTVDFEDFKIQNAWTIGGMFRNCSSLEYINLSDLDSNYSYDFGEMFSGCTSLKNVEFGNVKLTGIMDGMFKNCSSLTSMNLSNFDFANGNSMTEMFSGCTSLEKVDFGNLSKLSGSMSRMFKDCSSLASVDFSNFDIINAYDITEMFSGCSSLASLDLSKFDTSNIADMTGVFSNCTSLMSLNISGFDTSYAKKMDNMFLNCNSLESITLGENFTKRGSKTAFPNNIWINEENDLIKSSEELFSYYPTNTYKWSGTWKTIIPVDLLYFNETNLIIEIGQPKTLKAKIYPSDATIKELKWTSSNDSIVSVDSNGKLTGNKEGTAIIIAKTIDGSSLEASCEVTVKKTIIEITSVALNKTSLTLDINKTETLKATIKPDNSTNKKITWTSSDSSVATVDSNGKVTGKKAGIANITAKTSNGKTVACKITVKNPVVDANSLLLNKTSITLKIGESETLKATIKPDNSTNKKITWTSSDSSVATVDSNGKVTGKKAGIATITAKTSNGKTVTCNVVIKHNDACSINGNMHLEWRQGENYKKYWCENGITQGLYGQKGNVFFDNTERGREIYDPVSNAWYWLDSKYDGAKAENKEVFMPYIYSNEDEFSEEEKLKVSKLSDTYTESYYTANMSNQVLDAINNKTGKWVRYDSQGKMIKGWYTVQGDDVRIYSNQIGNTYYYDYQTGLMAKGRTTINGVNYFFDEVTGVLQN